MDYSIHDYYLFRLIENQYRNKYKSDIEYFDSLVEKTENCWIWKGTKFSSGYGKTYMRKYALAHRFSWYLHKGEIPEGLLICHSCDNVICVAPHHLFLGTHKDNSQDMAIKGRSRKNRQYYIDNPVKGKIQIHLSKSKYWEMKTIVAEQNMTIKQFVNSSIMDKIRKEISLGFE